MDNLPHDFAFSLSLNKNALDYYSSLDFDTQFQIVKYIENAKDLDESRFRVYESINALSNNNTNFLFFL